MWLRVPPVTFIELLTQRLETPLPGPSAFSVAALLYVASVVAALFGQGGTVYAVSEVYFGHPTSARASLKRVRSRAIRLLIIRFVKTAVTTLALVLAVFPGIYLYCRWMTSVPAALLEDIGVRDSLVRGWNLTKGYMGRAFVIGLLYLVLFYVAATLLALPFNLMAQYGTRNPELARRWLEAGLVGTVLASIVVFPFAAIAESLFYFDLRVRKEALDLQLMLNPGAVAGSAAVSSMFS
jgi:hypothetical protein